VTPSGSRAYIDQAPAQSPEGIWTGSERIVTPASVRRACLRARWVLPGSAVRCSSGLYSRDPPAGDLPDESTFGRLPQSGRRLTNSRVRTPAVPVDETSEQLLQGDFRPRPPSRKQVAAMAKSDLKCPNINCAMSGKWTNLMVCRRCHRATVHAIYQPQTIDWRRRTSVASRPLARSAA
jgi:hypothetical protein